MGPEPGLFSTPVEEHKVLLLEKENEKLKIELRLLKEYNKQLEEELEEVYDEMRFIRTGVSQVSTDPTPQEEAARTAMEAVARSVWNAPGRASSAGFVTHGLNSTRANARPAQPTLSQAVSGVSSLTDINAMMAGEAARQQADYMRMQMEHEAELMRREAERMKIEAENNAEKLKIQYDELTRRLQGDTRKAAEEMEKITWPEYRKKYLDVLRGNKVEWT